MTSIHARTLYTQLVAVSNSQGAICRALVLLILTREGLIPLVFLLGKVRICYVPMSFYNTQGKSLSLDTRSCWAPVSGTDLLSDKIWKLLSYRHITRDLTAKAYRDYYIRYALITREVSQ